MRLAQLLVWQLNDAVLSYAKTAGRMLSNGMCPLLSCVQSSALLAPQHKKRAACLLAAVCFCCAVACQQQA
jgi:hypothetical protein